MEIWKDIEGFVGLYQVSNLGRVRSLDSVDMHDRTSKGRLRKCAILSSGYVQVILYNGEYKRTARVHRLVAETFIDNPEEKPEVTHIDFNRANNKVDNLEWITHRESIKRAINKRKSNQ